MYVHAWIYIHTHKILLALQCCEVMGVAIGARVCNNVIIQTHTISNLIDKSLELSWLLIYFCADCSYDSWEMFIHWPLQWGAALGNLLSFWTLAVMLWITEDLWREQWPFTDYMRKIRMSKKEGIQKNWGLLFMHIKEIYSPNHIYCLILCIEQFISSYSDTTVWICLTLIYGMF